MTGPGGPENTHCTHIGAVHRKMIYPALKEWFGMPIPEEYSKRRPAEDLMCWTEEATEGTEAEEAARAAPRIAGEASTVAGAKQLAAKPNGRRMRCGTEEWAKLLGNVEPSANPKVIEGKTEEVPGGTLARFAWRVEPGIVVPFLLITPKDAKGKVPVVVMVAQEREGRRS